MINKFLTVFNLYMFVNTSLLAKGRARGFSEKFTDFIGLIELVTTDPYIYFPIIENV